VLRLIETLVPDAAHGELQALLADAEIIEAWQEPVMDERRLVRVLVEADKAEPVLDLFEQRFSHLDNFRAVLIGVEATLPRPKEPEPEEPAKEKEEEKEKEKPPSRISREELMALLEPGTRVTRTFVTTVIFSAIVAATGLLRDNVAIIIGAMVIAPLLTPNMALALGATMGDLAMQRRALRTNVAGTAIAFVFAVATGAFLQLFPGFTTETNEFLGRAGAGPGDVVLALASGGAGALAFTTGVSASLVGVMVAVALLPPLVAAGVFVSAAEWAAAGGALLLLATNVICVNLAAVLTFVVKGVRPRAWWEADKARRATRRAFATWTLLLLVLVALILWST
jgi:uncharacterized hydrophobic protein (TIGR00341 family)